MCKLENMKKASMFLGILMMAVLGCDPENEPEAKIDHQQGKLKEVVLFSSLDDLEPNSTIRSYEYDERGRTSLILFDPNRTTQSPFSASYDKLEYDNSDKLIQKLRYRANTNEPTGYRLESTTAYHYNQDGLLSEETLNNSKKFSYGYENLRLKWRNEFEINGDLYQRIEFEYDNVGNKIAEWFYWPGQTVSTSKMNFVYENNVLISSDVSNCMRADWAYDPLGRVETEQRVQIENFCALATCVLRYYYHD